MDAEREGIGMTTTPQRRHDIPGCDDCGHELAEDESVLCRACAKIRHEDLLMEEAVEWWKERQP